MKVLRWSLKCLPLKEKGLGRILWIRLTRERICSKMKTEKRNRKVWEVLGVTFSNLRRIPATIKSIKVKGDQPKLSVKKQMPLLCKMNMIFTSKNYSKQNSVLRRSKWLRKGCISNFYWGIVLSATFSQLSKAYLAAIKIKVIW